MRPPPLGKEFAAGENATRTEAGRTWQRTALARSLLPVAWMAVLWWLSSIPGGPEHIVEGLSITTWFQKLMHVVAYAILAGTWTWALGGQLLFDRAVAAAFLFTSAYAVIDEIHQAYVPGRTSAATDVLIDLSGALIGIGALTAGRRRRSADDAD